MSDLGIRPKSALAAAGLDEELLYREPALVRPTAFFRLWEVVIEQAGHSTFPLQLAEALTSEVFNPPFFAVLCASNLQMGLERLAAYKKLVAPVRLQLQATEATMEIEICWEDPTLEPPPTLMAFELAFIVRLARMGTRTRIVPRAVDLRAPVHPESAYRDWLGVTPRAASRDGLSFSLEDAHHPFLTSSDALWSIFEPALRRRMTAIESGLPIDERVRASLLEAIPAGEISIDAVAPRLRLSTRSLQRSLSERGTSFSTLLREVREQLAHHYVARTKLPYIEIAFLLGYKRSNSFFRAFHDWTGKTPDQVRRESTDAPRAMEPDSGAHGD